MTSLQRAYLEGLPTFSGVKKPAPINLQRVLLYAMLFEDDGALDAKRISFFYFINIRWAKEAITYFHDKFNDNNLTCAGLVRAYFPPTGDDEAETSGKEQVESAEKSAEKSALLSQTGEKKVYTSPSPPPPLSPLPSTPSIPPIIPPPRETKRLSPPPTLGVRGRIMRAAAARDDGQAGGECALSDTPLPGKDTHAQKGDGDTAVQDDTPLPTDGTRIWTVPAGFQTSAVPYTLPEPIPATPRMSGQERADAPDPSTFIPETDGRKEGPSERATGPSADLMDGDELELEGDVETCDEYEADFAEFWKAWPKGKRKVAKKRCNEKYVRILRNKESTHAIIMDGLDRWKKCNEWTKDNGMFIPAPIVWLNQERWEADFNPENEPAEKSTPVDEDFAQLVARYEQLAQKRAFIPEAREAWDKWKAENLKDFGLKSLLGALGWAAASKRWTDYGGKFIPRLANWLSNGYRYVDYGDGWFGDWLEWKDHRPNEFRQAFKGMNIPNTDKKGLVNE